MPAHDFDDHHTLVGLGRGMKTVNRFCYDLNGGIEAERVIGSCQIVIDCFGDTDNRITLLAEKLVRNTQRVLAANRYQIIQAKLLPIGLKFLNVIHITEWIGPRRSQDRAAARNDARHGEIRLASSIQHSERLFHSIEFLLRYLPFQLHDIDIFAAACGPGSFTGLRIGIAAMEGFAAANGKRGAGVTTLRALAWKTGLRD